MGRCTDVQQTEVPKKGHPLEMQKMQFSGNNLKQVNLCAERKLHLPCNVFILPQRHIEHAATLSMACDLGFHGVGVLAILSLIAVCLFVLIVGLLWWGENDKEPFKTVSRFCNKPCSSKQGFLFTLLIIFVVPLMCIDQWLLYQHRTNVQLESFSSKDWNLAGAIVFTLLSLFAGCLLCPTTDSGHISCEKQDVPALIHAIGGISFFGLIPLLELIIYSNLVHNNPNHTIANGFALAGACLVFLLFLIFAALCKIQETPTIVPSWVTFCIEMLLILSVVFYHVMMFFKRLDCF